MLQLAFRMLPYYFFLSSRFYPLWLPPGHIFSISIFLLTIVAYGNDDDDDFECEEVCQGKVGGASVSYQLTKKLCCQPVEPKLPCHNTISFVFFSIFYSFTFILPHSDFFFLLFNKFFFFISLFLSLSTDDFFLPLFFFFLSSFLSLVFHFLFLFILFFLLMLKSSYCSSFSSSLLRRFTHFLSLSVSFFYSFFLSLFLKYKLFSLFLLNLFFLLSIKNSSYFLFFFIKIFTHMHSLFTSFLSFSSAPQHVVTVSKASLLECYYSAVSSILTRCPI